MPDISSSAGELVQKYVVEFLLNFGKTKDSHTGELVGTAKYAEFVQEMIDESKLTLYVDYADFVNCSQDIVTFYMPDLLECLRIKFYRVRKYLDGAIPLFLRELSANDNEVQEFLRSNASQPWAFALYNYEGIKPLRQLKMADHGNLVEVTGQPNRCSQLMCNNKDPSKFTLLTYDQSTIYGNWQRVKIQEGESDVPAGSMPRTIDVILRGEMCETCKPGDKITITGCLVVVPQVASLMKPGELKSEIRRNINRQFINNYMEGVKGLKDLGSRELTYKTVLYASVVRKQGQDVNTLGNQDDNMVAAKKQFTTDETQRIREIGLHKNVKNERDAFDKLADVIAPGVYGHSNIKKGLLLQMLGGVNKETQEGIKLRSDLNICIVGDPSTGKSQFLKYISTFMPRSIYTSGKTSTAAGLTASVMRDEDARDMVIEPGALMLADNGICCIDEFDKMDAKDQSAIHEAMEQQTITLSKAGIHATLNARASVLAAANPLKNSYDTSKSLSANVKLTAPIMSRFDLFFVLLDRPDERDMDHKIASHIINLHASFMQGLTGQSSQNNNSNMDIEGESEDSNDLKINQSDLQLYLEFARTINPELTRDARVVLRRAYRRLRQAAARLQGSYPITVRQLESMIRLSEAVARVHLDTKVNSDHIEMAFELMRSTLCSGMTGTIDLEMDEEERADQEQQEANEMNPEQAGVDGGQGGQGGAFDAADEAERQRQAGESGPGPNLGGVGGGPKTSGKTITLDYQSYLEIVRILMAKIKEVEEDNSDSGTCITQQKLVEYYQEAIEEKITTEDELDEHTQRVKLVIRRMIKKDRVLLVVDSAVPEAEQQLKAHPNYAG